MSMLLKASDVRKNWSQFNDDVVHKGPQFIKRNRDEWAAVSKEQLANLVGNHDFKAFVWTEEDGSVTITLRDIDIVDNGETIEETLIGLAEMLVDYAEDYMEHFTLYSQSPNRKQHFPYMMNVLLQDNLEGVRNLIQCQLGEK